jgi:hypothetical protein
MLLYWLDLLGFEITEVNIGSGFQNSGFSTERWHWSLVVDGRA